METATVKAINAASQISIPPKNNRPATIPVSATTDPTDKSNPPEIKATVIPITTIPFNDKPRIVLIIFALVKNTGDKFARMIEIRNIKNTKPVSRNPIIFLKPELKMPVTVE